MTDYKKQYAPREWLKYAFMACFCFGIGNYLNSDVSGRHGLVGIFTMSIG